LPIARRVLGALGAVEVVEDARAAAVTVAAAARTTSVSAADQAAT
jgi:hypothetical protein